MNRAAWATIGAGAAAILGLSLVFRSLRPEYRLHVLNDQKFVEADPRGLASLRGVDLDTYALASCMQSEEKTVTGRIAVGCATVNYCRRHGLTPSVLLLRSVYRGRRQPSHGRFASQEAPGKWAATSKPPTAETLLLARAILGKSPRVKDPTGGAERWDAPAAQDRAHARDPLTYTKDSRMIAADRERAGGTEVKVPGVPDTRFWKFS